MTKRAAHKTPLLEWMVGGLGALIFVAILGAVLWHGFIDQGAPPSIQVEATRIEAVAGGHVVAFEARNEGDVTAAQVRIVARLSTAANDEEHEATIDFLPPQSTRRGGFFFAHDPGSGRLQIRADGYNDP